MRVPMLSNVQRDSYGIDKYMYTGCNHPALLGSSLVIRKSIKKHLMKSEEVYIEFEPAFSSINGTKSTTFSFLSLLKIGRFPP